MNVPSFYEKQNENRRFEARKTIWVDGSRERRSLEIRRRIQELQAKRDNLEKELKQVRNCLISLDAHLQNDFTYKQLIIGN